MINNIANGSEVESAEASIEYIKQAFHKHKNNLKAGEKIIITNYIRKRERDLKILKFKKILGLLKE